MSRDDDFTWEQWYPHKWISDDELHACSPSARGCWMDWLMKMWSKDAYRLSGTFADFARWASCSVEIATAALRELDVHGAANVRFCGEPRRTNEKTDVTLTSRYRRRKYRERKSNADRQKRHRDKEGRFGVTPECGARAPLRRGDETRVEENRIDENRREARSANGSSGESSQSSSNNGASKIGLMMRCLIGKVVIAMHLDKNAEHTVKDLMSGAEWTADYERAVDRMLHEARKSAKNDSAYVIASLKTLSEEHKPKEGGA